MENLRIECPKMRFIDEQEAAYNIIKSKADVLLFGKGGTGKSQILYRVVSELTAEERARTLIVTPTGIASTLYEDAHTIHSAFGFHTGVYAPDAPLVILPQLLDIDRLIIDEIAMVRYDIFHQIMRLVDRVELIRQEKIQIILLGDILQLPPVLKPQTRSKLNELWKDELGYEIENGYFYNSYLYFERGFAFPLFVG